MRLLVLLLTFAGIPSAHALNIVYTNDVMGELEPCGCRHNPTGGLTRKYEFTRRLEDPEQVAVDGGNLLFDTDEVPASLAAQAEVQADYLLRAHDLLGHALSTPGTKDFGLGLQTFQNLTAGRKMRFISVNLFRTNPSRRLLDASAVLERKNAAGKTVKLGFIGVSYPAGNWARLTLEARDPVPLLKEEIKRLRPTVDYLYVLSQLGQAADENLAETVTGIDGIFGARTQSLLQTPIVIGAATLFQASFRNQYVGAYNPETKAHRLNALDEGYEPKDRTLPIVKLVAEFKAKVAEVNRNASAQLTQAAIPTGAPRFQTFPRCMECHTPQFDFWRKTPHANALAPLIQAKQHENKDCLRCHTVGIGEPNGWESVTRLGEFIPKTSGGKSEAWATTDIHSFMQSVIKAKSVESKVRLRRNDPPLPMTEALAKVRQAWTPVQCENCHAPGGDHPFGSAPFAKTVADTQCLKCHTAERAPQWYGQDGKLDTARLKVSRAKVACPASPQL